MTHAQRKPSTIAQSEGDWRLCVAPMMDWTDRHCRYFHRLLAPHARLYTEMVTTGAILHGNRERLLGFDPMERPLALQLGGSDPEALARCARIAEDWGYDEVNLNVGCPSDRVQSGAFGACLMREPALVRDCLGAMRDAVSIPVTVKHRLGVDDQDTERDLDRFVQTVYESGCRVFIVHARKAWLQGLSPKENRDIPPLDYARVHRLRTALPDCTIVINGGLGDVDTVRAQLDCVDGVMIGREAYQNPFFLAQLEELVYGTVPPSRDEVVAAMAEYVDSHVARGGLLKHVSRHLLGLFAQQPGARKWRRYLSENAHRPGAGPETLELAMASMRNCG